MCGFEHCGARAVGGDRSRPQSAAQTCGAGADRARLGRSACGAASGAQYRRQPTDGVAVATTLRRERGRGFVADRTGKPRQGAARGGNHIGAGVLAALGVFSLIGSTLSGWLCGRFHPRALLFWYYSLRGLSLNVVPFSDFDFVSLSIFSIFYGLDWVATGPATFAPTNEIFGRRDTPVILSWIFAGHQIGGALAALGAGAVRTIEGDYFLAFLASGLACLLASVMVLRI